MAERNSTNTEINLDCQDVYIRVLLNNYEVYIEIILQVINIISSIPAITLNVLIIQTIATNKNLQTTSNIFLCSITINNLLISTIVVPLWSCIIINSLLRIRVSCMITNITTNIVTMVGLAQFISMFYSYFDRYIAVIKPYFYQRKLAYNKKLYMYSIFGSWCLVLGLHVIKFSTGITKLPNYSLAILAGVIVLFGYGFQIHIYWTFRKITKTIRSHAIVATCHSNESTSQNRLPVDDKEKKFIYLTFALLISLCCCNMPFGCVILMRLFWFENFKNGRSLVLFYHIAGTLVILKSLIDPMITLYQLTTVRKHIIKTVKRFAQINPNIDSNIPESMTETAAKKI